MTSRGLHTPGKILIVSIAVCLCLAAVSCARRAPTPTVAPTLRPTPTVPANDALQGMRFVIEYDGQVVATEELFAQQVEQGFLVTSELRRAGSGFPLERRSLLISTIFKPLSYELEIGTARAHSSWQMARDNDLVSVLNNNLARVGPVMVERITPLPDVLLDGTPSALPFVILALQLTEGQQLQELVSGLRYLDVLNDLPSSQPLTLTQSSSLKGTVIGTLAYRGEALESTPFTLWLRPSERSLYSVEFDRYLFNPWLLRADPALARVQRVTIRRVGTLPAFLESTPPAGRTVELEFQGSDGSVRKGTLTLPEGAGPYPCLVLHGAAGVAPSWGPVQAAAAQGWGVFIYDKPGLGASEGAYGRGGLANLAQDALRAAAMLRSRPEIRGPLVFMGIEEGGIVGALASAQPAGYDAFILLSTALASPMSDAVEARVAAHLGQVYGWDEEQVGEYLKLSLDRWRALLFAGQQELIVSGRRIDLRPLEEFAALVPVRELALATVPILVIAGASDPWIDIGQLETMIQEATGNGSPAIALETITDWDGAIQSEGGTYLVSALVDPLLFSWLAEK